MNATTNTVAEIENHQRIIDQIKALEDLLDFCKTIDWDAK